MNLAATQRVFGAWLRGGAMPRFGDRSKPGLRVYRNTYRAQLVACLEESFPHTRSWIGGEAFHDTIVAHVARVPPSSWTLDAYAQDFPDTLAQLYPADPEVAEIAALERALDDAFIAPDAEPLDADMLGDIDWDRAILRFTPTLDLVEMNTNAVAIRNALSASEPPPAAERLREATMVLVWRQHMTSCFRTIDAAETHALLLARAGTSFAALCAAIVDPADAEDGVNRAGTYLGRWLADGLIINIEGDEPCAPSRS